MSKIVDFFKQSSYNDYVSFDLSALKLFEGGKLINDEIDFPLKIDDLICIGLRGFDSEESGMFMPAISSFGWFEHLLLLHCGNEVDHFIFYFLNNVPVDHFPKGVDFKSAKSVKVVFGLYVIVPFNEIRHVLDDLQVFLVFGEVIYKVVDFLGHGLFIGLPVPKTSSLR